MEIILFCFGVIGLTHIIVDSFIMEPVRNWFFKPSFSWNSIKDFFKTKVFSSGFFVNCITTPISHMMMCYQCSGFWSGLICGWMVFPTSNWAEWLVMGFAGSFMSNFATSVMQYLEAKSFVDLPPEEPIK